MCFDVPGVGMVNRRFFLYVFYILFGISSTIFSYCFLMDLQSYDLSMSELSYMQMFPFIPWGIKCLATAFSDMVKCFNMNIKPYIIMNNLMAAVFCFLMLIENLTLLQYCGILFCMQFFASWAASNYDAVMIYEGNLDNTNDEGKFQMRCSTSKSVGRIIGLGCAAPLYDALGSDGVYGIMSACFLTSMLFSFCFVDMPTQSPSGAVAKSMPVDAQGRAFEEDDYDTVPTARNSFCFSMGLITASIRNKHILPMLIFVVVSGVLPSTSTPTFFFLNDVVQLKPYQFGMLNIIGELAGIVVNLLFEYVFLKFSIRTLYILSGALKVVAGIMPYFLSKRASPDYAQACSRAINETSSYNDTCYYYEQHNLSPFGLALGENVMGEILDDVQSIPLYVVMRAISYHAMGPTVFQTIYALGNLVNAFQKYLNSVMLPFFNIDHNQFEGLPDYAIFCTALDAVWSIIGAFCLMRTIPLSELAEEINIERITREEMRPIIFNNVPDIDTRITAAEVASYPSLVPPPRIPVASIRQPPALPSSGARSSGSAGPAAVIPSYPEGSDEFVI
jgi:hypothetical protein